MSGYCTRPTEMAQAYGYYWPDGVPSEWPPVHKLHSCSYVDMEGQTFRIAYTDEQIIESAAKSFGIWSPYIPLFVTSPILPRGD